MVVAEERRVKFWTRVVWLVSEATVGMTDLQFLNKPTTPKYFCEFKTAWLLHSDIFVLTFGGLFQSSLEQILRQVIHPSDFEFVRWCTLIFLANYLHVQDIESQESTLSTQFSTKISFKRVPRQVHS